jgi:hypothetical protein
MYKMPAFVLILRCGVGKFDDGPDSSLVARYSVLGTRCWMMDKQNVIVDF